MTAYYSDNFHNRALIERTKSAPYYGAKKKTCYRLICLNSDNFVYWTSVYPTRKEAEAQLKEFSGGTFKRF